MDFIKPFCESRRYYTAAVHCTVSIIHWYFYMGVFIIFHNHFLKLTA